MPQERQDYDNDAWDLNDDASDISIKQLTRSSVCDRVVSAVAKQFQKPATLVKPLQLGGNNILYRVHVDGLQRDILVRLPCPNLSEFPMEKTLQEAATGLLLRQTTRLPVPQVFRYEAKSEIGPFTMLPYVQNNGDMSDVLAKDRQNNTDVPVLDEDIDEDLLKEMYTKLASCLLQLCQPEFSRIGSLKEHNGRFFVTERPITQNMSNMVQLANIPHEVLPPPNTTYETADEWYVALATMHLAQLVFQHNDLVSSIDDCRNKYISRFLFRKLAKEGKLSKFGFAEDDWSAQAAKVKAFCAAPKTAGHFRLWCDDLRPANFLVDEYNNIVAAIDWEFTYVAPTQFVLDPPWWLLLEMPEMWFTGMDDWAQHYHKRLEIWISGMEMAEAEATPNAAPFKLSEYMHESWKMGRFWLSYAARKSWAFDAIYWKYLDERFFGERQLGSSQQLWEARIGMLSCRERMAMDAFVEKKMTDSQARTLVSWKPGEANDRMAEVLVEDAAFLKEHHGDRFVRD